MHVTINDMAPISTSSSSLSLLIGLFSNPSKTLGVALGSACADLVVVDAGADEGFDDCGRSLSRWTLRFMDEMVADVAREEMGRVTPRFAVAVLAVVLEENK